MLSNVGPFQAECPSVSCTSGTGCSLYGNLRKADNVEGSLQLDCIHTDGSACPQTGGSAVIDGSTGSDGSLRGVRFALASMGLFFVPILLALTGAILSMSHWGRSVWSASDSSAQLLGATSGMLIGTLGTIVGARVLRAHSLEGLPLEFKSPERLKGAAP